MDYRDLYKAGRNNILNSTAKNKRNLKVNKERSTKRNTLFLNGRDMKDCSINKSNSNAESKPEKLKKISKQEEYLARYIKWKAEKEKRLKEDAKICKPKPFVTVVKGLSVGTAYKFEPPKKFKNNILENTEINENKAQRLLTLKSHEKENKCFKKPLDPVKSTNIPKANLKAPVVKLKSVETKVATKLDGKKNTALKGNQPTNGLRQTKKIRNENCTPLKIEGVNSDNNALDFSNAFTSTGRKSQNPNLLHIEKFFENLVSPIEADFTVESISTDNKAVASEDKIRSKIACPSQQQQGKLPPKEEPRLILQCSKISTTSPNIIENVREPTIDLDCTPHNVNDNETSNYMSPFVTISRGKVSAKKEREKRESIYKLEESSPADTIEVRRSRESVKYFRKLLKDEINRLHSQCEVWELYQKEETYKIEENGNDMINATIGQTKLLTSKKLEQFRGLIDRCERGLGNNKGEQTNLEQVLPEDLEGFWSMVQLQIENVDKRFENLKRWKFNDWNDPDEKKPKPKLNLRSKVTKTKKLKSKSIKPNGQLMDLLKKAKDVYRNKKGLNNDKENDVIFVTHKRKSIINRRSGSNTPIRKSSRHAKADSTDLDSKNSSNRKRKSINRTSSRNSTPRRSDIKARRSLLVNTLTKFNDRKSLGNQLLPNSPLLIPRKSILKTPGTLKKQKQKVIFNEELDFNSPEYDVNGIEVLNVDDNELQRSMRLRSRRVIRRRVSEIEIP